MLFSVKIIYFIISVFFLSTLFGTPFFISLNRESQTNEETNNELKLHGNFLHITDFHPDPHYVSNITVKSRCHKHLRESDKPEHMLKGVSGPWGAPAAICDTPVSLIDATFEWLEKNWKNKLDFIIWTGDNSRHDRDEALPRTPAEIFQLNRMISQKFLKTFADKNKKDTPHFIPIVPSIGNNDIYPNNIISAGPNHLLSALYDIWSPFIPKGQHKTFLNGGYFYTEVIKGKLIVVSLNTLYFFKKNTAVNGCMIQDQPGTIEMKWLKDVLKKARKLGMKVYLTGHVAPRAKQYTISCYKKYGRLSLQYQDIILGHYYGHSNMDHFFFINSKNVKKGHRKDNDGEVIMDDDLNDDEEDLYDDDDDNNNNSNYNDQKQLTFDNNDGKIDKDIEKYMRKLLDHYRTLPPFTNELAKDYVVIHINPSIIPTFFPALRIFNYNTTKVIQHKTTNESTSTTYNPDAPSQKNTFLTPLGYTQYFINLTHANLYPNIKPEFTVEYTTRDGYNMKDLTVPSWIQLARKIVYDGLNSALWDKIRDHLLVGTRSLISEKNKNSFQNCIYSECSTKGPEDYIASELWF